MKHLPSFTAALAVSLVVPGTASAVEVVLPSNTNYHILNEVHDEDITIRTTHPGPNVLVGNIQTDHTIRIIGDAILQPSLSIEGLENDDPERLDLGGGYFSIETPLDIAGDNGVAIVVLARQVKVQRDIEANGFVTIGLVGNAASTDFVQINSGVNITVNESSFQSESYDGRFEMLAGSSVTSANGFFVNAEAGIWLEGTVDTQNVTFLTAGRPGPTGVAGNINILRDFNLVNGGSVASLIDAPYVNIAGDVDIDGSLVIRGDQTNIGGADVLVNRDMGNLTIVGFDFNNPASGTITGNGLLSGQTVCLRGTVSYNGSIDSDAGCPNP